MIMASQLTSLALLSLFVTFVFASPVTSPREEAKTQSDVENEAEQLVSQIRLLAKQAKNGLSVETIAQDVLDIEKDTQDLIQQLDTGVSQCETDLVIKTAAAGIGSHEVLTLLLADDELKVLNGRLALSLAFLERVAQQLEDQLSVSTDVGPQLAAIVFGTNATASIAETAEIVVGTINSLVNNNGDEENSSVRRDVSDVRLGNGWSVGQKDGVRWQSSVGRATVFLKPKAALYKNGGALKRQTSLSVNPSWDKNSGLTVGGDLSHKFSNGKTSLSLTPSWNFKNDYGTLGGKLSHDFSDKTSGSLFGKVDNFGNHKYGGRLDHKIGDNGNFFLEGSRDSFGNSAVGLGFGIKF